jgi:hypothetical protein
MPGSMSIWLLSCNRGGTYLLVVKKFPSQEKISNFPIQEMLREFIGVFEAFYLRKCLREW